MHISIRIDLGPGSHVQHPMSQGARRSEPADLPAGNGSVTRRAMPS